MASAMSLIREMPEKRALEYMKISFRYELDFLDIFNQYLENRRSISKYSFERFCREKKALLQVST